MKTIEIDQSKLPNKPWNSNLGQEGGNMKHSDEVIEVRVLAHLELLVKFFDGTSGVVKFLPTQLNRVFKPLNDPEFFKLVTCKDGYVSWPGEIDLAPDAMHQIFQENDVWIVPGF